MADAELEQEQQTKRPPCSGLRKELKDCIISSDCVIKYGHTPKECLKGDLPGVDQDCRMTQLAFFDCKRSLIDFRNRFRGRKGY